MSQVVKFSPKTLTSNYTLLSISDIVEQNQDVPLEKPSEPVLQLRNIPFRISNRKMMRGCKR
jgi:hypothetical protein